MLRKYFDENKYEEIKNLDNPIYKALEIVMSLFESDVDKAGMPYILHILYVYSHVSTTNEKIIALLHDVIEDKDVSMEDLLDIGFEPKIVDDVIILTRAKSIEYQDYIDNIVKNGSKEALNVKLADLTNNMDISRIRNPIEKDYERLETKYKPAYQRIINRLKEMN